MEMTYRIGSRGEMVRQIQKALGLLPDGYFGPLTREAVETFQRSQGIKADGIVGPATLARLIPQRLKKSTRRIDEIIIHCTATPPYMNATVEDIRQWHKKQGWSDIGYHYVIYRDGTMHLGRDVNLIGAHCQGHNSHSIGVVYVGGVASDGKTPKDTRTDVQKAAMLSLLLDLRKIYPKAGIFGHRDFAPKDCPSFDATNEYRKI